MGCPKAAVSWLQGRGLYPTLVNPTSTAASSPEEATKAIGELEQLCREERLRELGLFRQEKTGFRVTELWPSSP